jgi:hypothetical protein
VNNAFAFVTIGKVNAMLTFLSHISHVVYHFVKIKTPQDWDKEETNPTGFMYAVFNKGF